MNAAHNMPGAWYDLSSRVLSAQAVAGCALDALPVGMGAAVDLQLVHAHNLIGALQDILGLIEQDAALIEEQLNPQPHPPEKKAYTP